MKLDLIIIGLLVLILTILLMKRTSTYDPLAELNKKLNRAEELKAAKPPAVPHGMILNLQGKIVDKTEVVAQDATKNAPQGKVADIKTCTKVPGDCPKGYKADGITCSIPPVFLPPNIFSFNKCQTGYTYTGGMCMKPASVISRPMVCK